MFFAVDNSVSENGTGTCIWCKKNEKTNIAHIISKKLLKSDHKNNKLTNSVCEKCNSFFGENIEDWIFKYSPISFWVGRDILNDMTLDSDRSFIYKKLFLWFKEYNEWFVATNMKGRQFPSQIIKKDDGRFYFYVYEKVNFKRENHLMEIQEIITHLQKKNYTTYLSSLLPQNFHSRIFRFNDIPIVIARNDNQAELFIKKILEISDVKKILLKSYRMRNKEHRHLIILYKWSFKKYSKFYLKIIFEYLSLIKGSEFVLRKEFDDLRKSVKLKNNSFVELMFLNGQGFNRKLFPRGYFQIIRETLDKEFKMPIFELELLQQYTFSMILYKNQGYLCASLKLFEIEQFNIVLAKIEEPLESIYLITYSADDNSLNFYEPVNSMENFDEKLVLNIEESNIDDFN